MMFGLRLRIWTTRGLSTDDDELIFQVDGIDVFLKPQDKQTLREPGWLVLKAWGFASEQDAERFGRRLGFALQVSSVRRFWGADIGHDNVTTGIMKPMREAFEAQGQFIRSNVHGLDIYPDRIGTSWIVMNMEGIYTIQPDPLISDLVKFSRTAPDLPANLADALRVWNEAINCKEPIAQTLLSITAVETLAQGEDWSPRQRDSISAIVRFVENEVDLPKNELIEIIDAVSRMHRIGVSQVFRRLFDNLEMQYIYKPWKKLYSRRSEFIHGLIYTDKHGQSIMAHPALVLSGRVLLTALSRYVPQALNDIDAIMPMPNLDS